MDDLTVAGGSPARIQVDADQLISALQSDEYDAVWFLDTKTGEIGLFWDGMLNGEDVDEDFDIDEYLDPDRHERIEGIDSSESYEVMEDFIETLPPGNARNPPSCHLGSQAVPAVQGRPLRPRRRPRGVVQIRSRRGSKDGAGLARRAGDRCGPRLTPGALENP